MRSLTKRFRTRAAILIALAYAFCVLAPSVALAFADSSTSFHCLAELNEMSAPSAHAGMTHAHADGTVHHHDQSGAPHSHSDTDGKARTGDCCGLFCVSALANDPGMAFGVSTPASPVLPAVTNGLADRAPAPLHRPPIT
jgi:hypothetical protein